MKTAGTEAMDAYIAQEYKRGFKDQTWEFLQFMHNQDNSSIADEIIKAMDKKFLTVCTSKLRKERKVQFVYDGLFYDLFESVEGGWIVNVYPNDKDRIFDEDGELIDDEQIDGGLCTGSATDAVYFMLGGN